MTKSILLTVALMALLVRSLYITAWTGPTDNPAEGNVDAPINVGAIDQVKSAGLGVTNLVADDVLSTGAIEATTQMRAPEYCDEAGWNCLELGSGWGTWQNKTGIRVGRVWYQNTTGAGLAVHYHSNYSAPRAYVSPTGSSADWVEVAAQDGDSGEWGPGFFIVPPDHYYYIDTGASMKYISELKLGF